MNLSWPQTTSLAQAASRAAATRLLNRPGGLFYLAPAAQGRFVKASRHRSALADDEFWEQYLYRRLNRLGIQDGNEHFYRALSLKRKIMADGCQRRVKETGFRKVIVAPDYTQATDFTRRVSFSGKGLKKLGW
jgi:hypothetical protein